MVGKIMKERNGSRIKIKIRKRIIGVFSLCFGLVTAFFWAVPAWAEGDTRYDAGLNLPFNEKAGDVNPQTGNIILNVTDLELPGRGGLNFRFGRVWSLNQASAFTMYRDPYDGSNKLSSETMERYNRLGVGWSANIPYIFKDNSSGLQVINLCFNGNVYELDKSGLALYKSKINPDKSNILWYDLLDLRVYQETGIRYDDYSGFAGLSSEYGIADRPETENAYVLTLKDNSKYWFREDGKLMMREDRTGLNRIWYFYDTDARLKLVVDTADRKIRFMYDEFGNLSAIEWDVKRGIKQPDGQRAMITETRRISYQYESAEQFDIVSSLKPYVVGYRQPFILTAVTDPEECVTSYAYQEGSACFTFDSFKERSQNLYLLLTEITSMADEEGNYKYKRCFEYEPPAQGLYTKRFYQGYIEYYKISRQYFKDRHGREMNDTSYLYHASGEAGNVNQYTAVIKQGKLKTTYVYSLSGEKSQDNVLDKMIIETEDGFVEERDFVYNANRAKILDEVYRGQLVYREKYDYDLKGNLKWHQDKKGLVVATEYDEKYSIPRHVVKKLEVDGKPKEYETEYIINELGQVTQEIVYLEQDDGSKKAVVTARNGYDQYGNLIRVTDARGHTVHTVYDEEYHLFPIKVYQDVTVADWSAGTATDWFSNPDDTKKIRVRNWKVFNSDGTVWIEVDNEGYAIEHYYDKKGAEIETVVPDEDDVRSFAQAVTIENNLPEGADFDNFLFSPDFEAFLASRQNNPGVRHEISYTDDFVKTFTDLDVEKGEVKVTGKQGDGLGHVEEEIEYDGTGAPYAVKNMSYDLLGRMVATTDPDAGANYYLYNVNGVRVKKHDKTWIIEYDDLGRQKWIIYPETEPGRTDTKRFRYNDQENSVTITDSLGRRVYERRDWNDNLIQTIRYGDWNTRSEDIQEYKYTYDKLNRLSQVTDPQGIVTTYLYDERNLLLEERYGTTGKDVMAYDELGLLIQKTDRKGQILVMEYDEMGRNTAVIHYRSAEDYENDLPCRRVETVYDNRGNAVWVSSEALTEYYTYDHNNNITRLERRLKDPLLRQEVAGVWGSDSETQSFGFTYTYNDAGMITRMTYPDGAVHTYEYDAALGRLEQIKAVTDAEQWINEGGNPLGITPFVTGLEYTPSGVVTRMEYANQTVQTWEFDHRKRISRINVSGPEGVIEELKYKLNAAGDILSINENEYAYDGFDRIIQAKTLLPNEADKKKLVARHFGTYEDAGPVNGLYYRTEADLNSDGRINGADHTIASLLNDATVYDIESFEYDKNGNRTKLVQNGDTYTYEYGERNRLDAVYVQKNDSAVAKPVLKYIYDANGNTIERIVYTATGEIRTSFEYDTLNRVTRTAQGGKVTDYFYDNAGNRFIKKGPEGTTLYLRHGQIAVAMDIEVSVEQTECVGTINRYVLSGDLLAGRITTKVMPDGTKEIKNAYYHLDHLNSTKCVSNEDGQVEVRYIYRAFGEQLAKLGTGEAKYTYGGKELDNENKLYYFNARYYDAVIGRFISVDPAKDGLNWYVYAGNNPLRLVDPTGLKTEIATHSFIHTLEENDLPGPVAVFFQNIFSAWSTQKIPWSLQGVLDGIQEVNNGKKRNIDLLPGDVITSKGTLYELSEKDKVDNNSIPKEAVYSIEINTTVKFVDGGFKPFKNTMYICQDSEGNYYDPRYKGVSKGTQPEQIMQQFDCMFLQAQYYDLHEGLNEYPRNEAPKEKSAIQQYDDKKEGF